jgi:hypothetical protein
MVLRAAAWLYRALRARHGHSRTASADSESCFPGIVALAVALCGWPCIQRARPTVVECRAACAPLVRWCIRGRVFRDRRHPHPERSCRQFFVGACREQGPGVCVVPPPPD